MLAGEIAEGASSLDTSAVRVNLSGKRTGQSGTSGKLVRFFECGLSTEGANRLCRRNSQVSDRGQQDQDFLVCLAGWSLFSYELILTSGGEYEQYSRWITVFKGR
jgi:hypothetical protein